MRHFLGCLAIRFPLFITFLQFVRPAVLKMMGASTGELDLPKVSAELAVDLRNESDRPHYVRGRLENGKFSPVGRQESHALFGLSQSNALLRLGVAKPDQAAKVSAFSCSISGFLLGATLTDHKALLA
jgi:Molybdopterin biosynthesis enzyme